MRAVVQRVRCSSVKIDGKTVGEIGRGLNVLLGISPEDTEKECDFLLDKIVKLRIFGDENGKLNRSLLDVQGELLVISQFTLFADCHHGRRPSFLGAARPETAIPLYERFLQRAHDLGIFTQCGEFGADMLVHIDNDGPVTILLDTKELLG